MLNGNRQVFLQHVTRPRKVWTVEPEESMAQIFMSGATRCGALTGTTYSVRTLCTWSEHSWPGANSTTCRIKHVTRQCQRRRRMRVLRQKVGDNCCGRRPSTSASVRRAETGSPWHGWKVSVSVCFSLPLSLSLLGYISPSLSSSVCLSVCLSVCVSVCLSSLDAK